MASVPSPIKAASPLLRTFVVLLLITMVAYPFFMTGIGQFLFPSQANGTQMVCDGHSVGSALIAQNVSSPKLFWPRNATASASGLDPDIAPAEAYAQVPRISNATNISASSLDYLIWKNIQANQATNLGYLAPDYVNVNQLNLDLIQFYPTAYAGFCA
ncbi:MAG TPA: potassium-transporting ATPase subunit C [Thermoplasmata archaeon]|nr:potassium-transporting ATPase subunit C [Thermoplasmata archaeon]